MCFYLWAKYYLLVDSGTYTKKKKTLTGPETTGSDARNPLQTMNPEGAVN